jgi:hypothetical protein
MRQARQGKATQVRAGRAVVSAPPAPAHRRRWGRTGSCRLPRSAADQPCPGCRCPPTVRPRHARARAHAHAYAHTHTYTHTRAHTHARARTHKYGANGCSECACKGASTPRDRARSGAVRVRRRATAGNCWSVRTAAATLIRQVVPRLSVASISCSRTPHACTAWHAWQQSPSAKRTLHCTALNCTTHSLPGSSARVPHLGSLHHTAA